MEIRNADGALWQRGKLDELKINGEIKHVYVVVKVLLNAESSNGNDCGINTIKIYD